MRTRKTRLTRKTAAQLYKPRLSFKSNALRLKNLVAVCACAVVMAAHGAAALTGDERTGERVQSAPPSAHSASGAHAMTDRPHVVRPDYVYTICREIPSAGDNRSAQRIIDPEYALKNLLYQRYKRDIELGSMHVHLSLSPRRGDLLPQNDGTGRILYFYHPRIDGGIKGRVVRWVGRERVVFDSADRVAFLVTAGATTYKVVVNILVAPSIPENVPSACASDKFVKSKK